MPTPNSGGPKPPKLRLRGFPIVSVFLEPRDWLYILARVLAAPPDASDSGALLLYVSRVLLAAGRHAPGYQYDIVATKLRKEVDALAVELGAFDEPEVDVQAGQIRVYSSADAIEAFRAHGVLLQAVDAESGALQLVCAKCGTRWASGADSAPAQVDCPSCGPQPESEPST